MPETNLGEKDNLVNIDFCENLLNSISQLYFSNKYSDVVFIVEDQRLSAHKCILAAGSKYFDNLLYGDFSESSRNEIELKVPLEAFTVLLRFIYSGRICLKDMEEETIVNTQILAYNYGLNELVIKIFDYLMETINIDNTWVIFKLASYCYVSNHKEILYRFIDKNASKLLRQESFNYLSKELLQIILRRDSFLASEFEIFTAVSDWCKYNPDVDADSVLSCIRFPLMSDYELLKVRQFGIVKVEKLMDAVEVRSKSRQLRYRVWPDENMAALELGSRIIKGTGDIELGDIFRYDIKDIIETCNPAAIKTTMYEGIVVELGIPSIINCIEIQLQEFESFSYFLEVFTNLSQWERVVDYRDCNCRDLQSLYFPPKFVKYIKLVATSEKGLTIVTLNATYVDIMCKQINGFIAATIEIHETTCEVEGVGKQNKTPSYTNSDIAEMEIKVQLNQPYLVSSVRLFLADRPDLPYNYSVALSTNEKDWWHAMTKIDDAILWRNISFPPCPVVFIKMSNNRSCTYDYILYEEIGPHF